MKKQLYVYPNSMPLDILLVINTNAANEEERKTTNGEENYVAILTITVLPLVSGPPHTNTSGAFSSGTTRFPSQ